MKYAICNEVYGDMPFDEACDHAKRAGYDGLEIAPFTLAEDVDEIDEAVCSRVRKAAERFSLEIVGLHWLLAGTSGLHLTSPEPNVQLKTLEHFRKLIRICHDIGGSIMVLGSPNERNLIDGVNEEDAFRYACDLISQLTTDLAAASITLAIEPLGREETNFINTAHSAVRLIEAIESPHVRLHLDVKAMSTESETIPEIIRNNANHLVHFHANDPNRQGPGMGEVDFTPIVAALTEVNYNGWVSVEVFDFSPGIERLVSGSIEYLKRCC